MTPPADLAESPVDAISFTDPQVQLCPFDAYRQVMEDRRLHRDPVSGWWEVLGYDDLMKIVQDPAIFSSEHKLYGERDYLAGYAETKRMFEEEEGYPTIPALINADEPAHRRNREIVEPSFRAARVRTLEPYIRELVNQLIDAWGDTREIEFMERFAVMLPVYVICDTIGVSRGHAANLKRWSDAMMQAGDSQNSAEENIRLTREIIDFQQFVAAEYEKARADPGENILGDTARARIDGGRVSTGLAVHIIAGLLVAGNETTTSTLGAAMKRMIGEPGMEERLRAEPGKIPDFIEEVLRLESPPQDALVVLRFGAGNRDPRRYPEPDNLDIDRPRIRQHLAFGGGIHMCIGHLLVRSELKIAYEELFKRFRNFRLTAEPTALPGYIAYGPRTMPIAFDRI
jgi:cytochrome P450